MQGRHRFGNQLSAERRPLTCRQNGRSNPGGTGTSVTDNPAFLVHFNSAASKQAAIEDEIVEYRRKARDEEKSRTKTLHDQGDVSVSWSEVFSGTFKII